MQRIVFRADGSIEIGLGHIHRCVAIAEVLQDKYDICFAVRNATESILDLLSSTANVVIKLSAVSDNKSPNDTELYKYLTGDEIVVLDGYHFSSDYQRNLKTRCRGLVCIDDIPDKHYYSDLIINYNGGIALTTYQREVYTQVIAGLHYAVLKNPFRSRNVKLRPLTDRLFLNMGGTDPENQTCRALEVLAQSNFKEEVEIVIGNHFPHEEALREVLSQRKITATIHKGLRADAMYERMLACTVAVLPPSTVALEFLSVGGLLFLHQTASNQALLREHLVDQKLAYPLARFEGLYSGGDFETLFEESLRRQEIVFKGEESGKRMLRVFDSLTLASQIKWRRATIDDKEICFQWANDPVARQYSYSPDPIPWEVHTDWFSKKIDDPYYFYFIPSIDSVRIGQVRFERENSEGRGTYTISYSLDRDWRSKGLGPYLVLKGIQYLMQFTDVSRIVGFVKSVNTSSIRSFDKAGFTRSATVPEKYPHSYEFELNLSNHEMH